MIRIQVQKSRVAAWLSIHLAEVARAVNALQERQAVFAGRLAGVEASQLTLAEGANSTVASLTTQARAEFQAQGSLVSETRAAVEALFASCSEELRNLKSPRTQEIA
eukprot:736946-Alexandrium_andersonii.AAC.1